MRWIEISRRVIGYCFGWPWWDKPILAHSLLIESAVPAMPSNLDSKLEARSTRCFGDISRRSSMRSALAGIAPRLSSLMSLPVPSTSLQWRFQVFLSAQRSVWNYYWSADLNCLAPDLISFFPKIHIVPATTVG